MKYKVIYIFTLLIYSNSYSDTCKRVSKIQEYNISDLIIVGEVIELKNNEFSVKIIDLLKGDPDNGIIKVEGSNISVLKLNRGEIWLF